MVFTYIEIVFVWPKNMLFETKDSLNVIKSFLINSSFLEHYLTCTMHSNRHMENIIITGVPSLMFCTTRGHFM